MLHKLLLDTFRISPWFVNLVDSDNDRHPCRFGVIDSLNRLRHNAIISRNDQDSNISDLGTACTHSSKGLMTRRIKEDNLLVVDTDLIGTNVLGNSARFALGDGGLADNVQK